MNATGDTMLGQAVGSDGLCRESGGSCWIEKSGSWPIWRTSFSTG